MAGFRVEIARVRRAVVLGDSLSWWRCWCQVGPAEDLLHGAYAPELLMHAHHRMRNQSDLRRFAVAGALARQPGRAGKDAGWMLPSSKEIADAEGRGTEEDR